MRIKALYKHCIAFLFSLWDYSVFDHLRPSTPVSLTDSHLRQRSRQRPFFPPQALSLTPPPHHHWTFRAGTPKMHAPDPSFNSMAKFFSVKSPPPSNPFLLRRDLRPLILVWVIFLPWPRRRTNRVSRRWRFRACKSGPKTSSVQRVLARHRPRAGLNIVDPLNPSHPPNGDLRMSFRIKLLAKQKTRLTRLLDSLRLRPNTDKQLWSPRVAKSAKCFAGLAVLDVPCWRVLLLL